MLRPEKLKISRFQSGPDHWPSVMSSFMDRGLHWMVHLLLPVPTHVLATVGYVIPEQKEDEMRSGIGVNPSLTLKDKHVTLKV